MAMELRRAYDDYLISDMVFWNEGWDDRYPEPVLDTITGRTYLQRRGVMEWFAEVTWMFNDDFENSTLDNMYYLKRLARARELLIFTDREGVDHRVRVRGRPEKEREPESQQEEIQLLTTILLLDGFEY